MGKYRDTRTMLQRENFDLQNHVLFNHEKTFSVFLEILEFFGMLFLQCNLFLF